MERRWSDIDYWSITNQISVWGNLMRTFLMDLLDATLGFVFTSRHSCIWSISLACRWNCSWIVMKECGNILKHFISRKISGTYYVVWSSGMCSSFVLYSYLVLCYLFVRLHFICHITCFWLSVWTNCLNILQILCLFNHELLEEWAVCKYFGFCLIRSYSSALIMNKPHLALFD